MYSTGTIDEVLTLEQSPALSPGAPGRFLLGAAAFGFGTAATAGLAAAAAAAWVILASLTANPTLEGDASAVTRLSHLTRPVAGDQVAPRILGLASPYGTLRGADRLSDSAAAIYFSPSPMAHLAADGMAPRISSRLTPERLAPPTSSVAAVSQPQIRRSAAPPPPSPFAATAAALAAAQPIPLPPERSAPETAGQATPLPPLRAPERVVRQAPVPPRNPFLRSRADFRAPPRREVEVRAPLPAPVAPTPAAPTPQASSNPIVRFFSALARAGSNAQQARNEDEPPGLPAFGSPRLQGLGSRTAIYDISTHTVFLPDGERLEAHSGLGYMIDNPRYVNEKDRGATPPHLYELSLRGPLFHGVQALRLTPIGQGAMYGRVGLLAHTYMLGPNGQSNGCVSFRDYPRFLKAYMSGQIQKLDVVARLGSNAWRTAARGRGGLQYASN